MAASNDKWWGNSVVRIEKVWNVATRTLACTHVSWPTSNPTIRTVKGATRKKNRIFCGESMHTFTTCAVLHYNNVLCEKYDNIMASRRSRDVFCGVTHKLKFCGDVYYSTPIPVLHCSNRFHKHKPSKNIYLNTRWILLWLLWKWCYFFCGDSALVGGMCVKLSGIWRCCRLVQCCQFTNIYKAEGVLTVSKNFWTDLKTTLNIFKFNQIFPIFNNI